MKTIDKNKRYKYIGLGMGRNELHSITSTGGQITTWSDGPSRMTWLGTPEEFRQQFEEV